MKLFLDTAQSPAIHPAHQRGALRGAATNPSAVRPRGMASPVAHVVEGARPGVDGTTPPLSIMERPFHHPSTDIGMARFSTDRGPCRQGPAARRGA